MRWRGQGAVRFVCAGEKGNVLRGYCAGLLVWRESGKSIQPPQYVHAHKIGAIEA
jgi:hypothetical protein